MKKITREIEFSRTEGTKFPEKAHQQLATIIEITVNTSKQATLKFQKTGKSEKTLVCSREKTRHTQWTNQNDIGLFSSQKSNAFKMIFSIESLS